MTDYPQAGNPPYYGTTNVPAGSAPPPPYPQAQPGEQQPLAPYAQEAPPKYEVPKEGPYAPQQPAGYQTTANTGYQTTASTTVYTQPVQQTIIIHRPVLGPIPCCVDCPNCHARVTTTISHKNGGLAWLSAGIICVFGCWLGCCLIPFCIPELQDVEHRCPNCNTHVGTYARL